MKVQERPRETLDRLPELPSDVAVPDDIRELTHPPAARTVRGKIRWARWLIALLVVAVVAGITVVMMTGGEDTQTAQQQDDVTVSRILSDPGPPWEPSAYLPEPQAAAEPDIEFGGMSAPTWHPNYGRLETYLGEDVTVAPMPSDPGPTWSPNYGRLETYLGEDVTVAPMPSDPGPTWHPNYGRLETYLGAETTSGPR